MSIVGRNEYQSTREIIADMLQKYKETHEFDEMRLAHILSNNHDEDFMWSLIVSFENQLAAPFVSLSRTNYELCVSALKQLNRSIEIYRPWTEYDTVAYWAAKVLQGRPNADDALSVEVAQLIEYVSSRANRYDIQRLANRLKNDTTIDSHIRALLTYHDIF